MRRKTYIQPRLNHGATGKAPTGQNTVSMEDYNSEKEAKYKAFYFILSHGLLKQYQLFSRHYESTDPQADCINYLQNRVGL